MIEFLYNMAYLKGERQVITQGIIRERNMELSVEDSLSLEALDKILASMPGAE